MKNEIIERMVKFNHLTNSKIFHDLINPLSSVLNGLELIDIQDNNNDRDEIYKHVYESAQKVVELIYFLRYVYGASFGNLGSEIQLSDLFQLFQKNGSTQHITFNTNFDKTLNVEQAKLIFIVLYFLSVSAYKEGEINIKQESNAEGKVIACVFYLKTPKLLYSESYLDDQEEWLNQTPSEVKVQRVLYYYLEHYSFTCNATINMAKIDNHNLEARIQLKL